jgi:RNA polymerase sigma factor (sigma-70 family)
MPENNSAMLSEVLKGCLQKNRRSQEHLYKMFYGYAMSVCLRYVTNREEAAEVMNDGFYKIFNKLDTYDATRPFKTWLGRVMVNTALDHYRRNTHQFQFESVENKEVPVEEGPITGLSYEDLIGLVERLSPVYRIVFSMAVIDGYSHEEIAEKLEITVGSSKSNLSRAREKLRMMLSKLSSDDYAGMAR